MPGFERAVIYDVIDVILESNNVDRLPRAGGRALPPTRAPLGPGGRCDRDRERPDRRPPRSALAIWRSGRPCSSTASRAGTPPDPRPDHIRQATGIPAERRVVLFLGRLGRERGLDEAAEAVLALPDAALVLIGFGPWADRLPRA